MDIGTAILSGILGGCTILGGTLTAWSILGNSKKKGSNPNSKYLLTERFEEYKEGVTKQLDTLTTSVTKIESGVKRVHSRIDEELRKK